jgi:hypothetical protein
MTPLFRYFLALVVLCLIGAAAMDANAADAELTWINPTKNTDDSAIPAACTTISPCGRLSTTRLEYGSCVGTAFGVKIGEIGVAQPATTAKVSALVPQVYCFRAFARNDYAQESAASNVATKTIAPPVPSPPVLRVVEPTAYRLDQGYKNKPQFKVAGLIPLGTLCHPIAQATDVTGATYQLTERTVVTPIGSLPLVAFAKCG